MSDIDVMIATVEEWKRTAQKDIADARDQGNQLALLGDEYGRCHFASECHYLSGRIDAYSDVLLSLREKRLGI